MRRERGPESSLDYCAGVAFALEGGLSGPSFGHTVSLRTKLHIGKGHATRVRESFAAPTPIPMRYLLGRRFRVARMSVALRADCL